MVSFRRSKNKATNAKFQGDDMAVSLTAGALSSSSSGFMEPKKGKSVRGFPLGRRKKNTDIGKGNSSSSVNINNLTEANDKPITSNVNAGRESAVRTNSIKNLERGLQLQTQPQHQAPESAPPQARNIPQKSQVMKKRHPSSNSNSTVTTKMSNPEDEGNIPHPPRPQPRKKQQKTKQQQPRQRQTNNVLETRDERRNKNGNLQPHQSSSSLKNPPLPNSSDASKESSVSSNNSNNKNARPTDLLSNVQIVAAAATAAVSKSPHNPSNGEGRNTNNINNSINSSVPIARSGWSVASNASSAMNSEHYIQSLDNLPALSLPKIRSGREFPMLSAQPDDRIRELADDRTRGALSRQFGRKFPPKTYTQKWYVKVSNPEWHDDESRYKYKINITTNPSAAQHDDNASYVTESLATRSAATESYSRLSFASTTACRSLQDFVWLEQALRAEYHGALIVPILSLALYFGSMSENETAAGEDESSLASRSLATDATSKGIVANPLLALGENGSNIITQSYRFIEEKMEQNEIVDGFLLATWLSDIINGIRGNGEFILHNSVDMMESEAMETFLYRHSETTYDGGQMEMGATQQTSTLGSPFNLFTIKNRCQDKTLLEDLVENPFACFGMDTVCGGEKKPKAQDQNMSLNSMMCSSGRTGVPGIDNCTSYFSQSGADFDFSSLGAAARDIATHSELLEAEKDLIASYIRSSSLSLSKMQALTKDEAYVGQCWKRFAISLSNLFSVEKDLEQAHIGDQIKSNKKNQPFRKLRKSAVDDALRVLARGKIDRSGPSLKTLRSMMSAYFADLNSVVPAFREYSEATNQLHQLNDAHSLKSNHTKKSSNQVPGNNEWPSSIEQLKALTRGVTKQFTGGETVATNCSDPTVDDESGTLTSLSTAQTKAFQTRVFTNEKTLKVSITLLCKASPLRNARMAWWYLKTEAKQALKVHTAASGLRQKLSIDADAAAAMKERRYDADEKKDNAAELKLVTRILDLVSQDDRGGMFDNDASRQNAIAIATEQVGRWNAKTALALMEAAGVADAEVQIDETSRELRHVRKYAISLRENVARCLESAEALASTFILNSEGYVQISRSRREFWAAVSVVFSGKIIPEGSGPNVPTVRTPSTRVLSSARIDVTDRGGWLGHNNSLNNSNQQRRNCGEAARQYLKKRDNQANILISRIVKLLKDYERRLEGIESFVYMHCVGIQLEKHCSRARSKALSAWEKRTDISTAINVATKKKIPKLVQELKVKLDSLPQVSHTTVLKRKEEHLASKVLKSDLHKLANRRFGRAQEVSTERVIAVMSLWAKHEESVAMEEVKALGEAVQEVELSVQSADVDAALDRHSFANRF